MEDNNFLKMFHLIKEEKFKGGFMIYRLNSDELNTKPRTLNNLEVLYSDNKSVTIKGESQDKKTKILSFEVIRGWVDILYLECGGFAY